MSFNLKNYNTFGLDVSAKDGIVLSDMAMFPLVEKKITENNNKFIVLGQGSDVLFKENYNGLVIINKLLGMDFTEDQDYYYVTCQSGEYFHDLIKACMARKIYGLENLAFIPGTAGAAPIQNVGAYGVSFADFCRFVEVIDLQEQKIKRFKCAECNFGYRTSIFKEDNNKVRYIVTSIGLKIPKKYEYHISYGAFQGKEFHSPIELYDFIGNIRNQKLPNPKEIGNAGSFFKNPIITKEKLHEILKEYSDVPTYSVDGDEDLVKIAAGWLIEKSGCKGKNIGRAGVYHKQALVIVNLGEASCDEIVNMAMHVIDEVIAKFGIVLEPEVRIYGSEGESSLC